MQRLLAPNLLLLPRWPSSVPADAKRLILIRHAEGWHNKDYNEKPNYMADGLGETEAYWDARLTPDGVKQTEALEAKLKPHASTVQLVTSSPLTRALQTASIAFPDRSKGHVRFVATSLARERVWNHQCDRRRARTDISAEFPHFDFSEIADGADEMWPHKETEPSPFNSSAVRVRAREMLQWIWARPESGPIAVVSHWVFLTHLLGLFNETEGLAADIGNADMRMVTLLRAPDEADKGKEPERGREEL